MNQERTRVVQAMLYEHLRREAAAVTDQIISLPRAADVSNEDARQLVHGLLRVIIEASSSEDGDAHATMVETMRSFVESGRPLGDAIRGLSRTYMMLSAVVVAGLAEGDRRDASIWLSETASIFLRDVVNGCVGAR